MNAAVMQCLPSGTAEAQPIAGRLGLPLTEIAVHTFPDGEIRVTAEADNLSAMPAIADTLRATGFDPTTIVVGPDAESEAWVSDLSGLLGLPYMTARKTRHGDRSVAIELPEPHAVRDRPVLMVDDLVSSGGTLAACARTLKTVGAATIDAVVTHALFPPGTVDEFARAGIRSIRSTNSVPHPTNAIALDDLLATALQNDVEWSPPRG